MATILLRDPEYDHIKTLKQELLTKAQAASPRAATHYQTLAKLCGNFVAQEDGKRATAAERKTTREDLQKIRDARRNGSAQQAAPTANPTPSTGRAGPTSKAS